MKKFGERLKELRTARGMTQGELAEEFGIARNSIFSYETDKRTPDIEVLGKCASFFGVTSDYLLGLSDNKTTEYAILGDELGLRDEAVEQLRTLNSCTKLIEKLNEQERKELHHYLVQKEMSKIYAQHDRDVPLHWQVKDENSITEKYSVLLTELEKMTQAYSPGKLVYMGAMSIDYLQTLKQMINLILCDTELLMSLENYLYREREKQLKLLENNNIGVLSAFSEECLDGLYWWDVEDKLKKVREKIKNEED